MNKIKYLRLEKGIKQTDLARQLNITQANLSGWENDKWQPDRDSIAKMCSIFKVSSDYLLGINNDECDNEPYYDIPKPTRPGSKWIPVRGKIAGGQPLEMIEYIEDWEEIDADTIRRGEIIALKVNGDSMSPRICNGDVVIIRVQPDVENGEIAAVAVNGYDATLKKIKKDTRGIYLVPLNTEYDTIFYSNEDIRDMPITIIGKMIELRGKF